MTNVVATKMVSLNLQKRLAAAVLKCGQRKVVRSTMEDVALSSVFLVLLAAVCAEVHACACMIMCARACERARGACVLQALHACPHLQYVAAVVESCCYGACGMRICVGVLLGV